MGAGANHKGETLKGGEMKKVCEIETPKMADYRLEKMLKSYKRLRASTLKVLEDCDKRIADLEDLRRRMSI
jgi:hypothetical protein